MNRLIWLLLLAALILQATAQAYAQELLKVYYVRHAEAGHNVLKEWQDKPKDQWPAYVGHPYMFTPKGEKQVAALAEQLKGMKFDFIAVSPTWRTRNTILPYLKASGQKGELWPELTEASHVPVEWTALDAKVRPPSPKLFEGKPDDALPEAEQPFFTFRDKNRNQVDTTADDKDQQIANSVALAQKTIDQLKTRFGHTNKSVLLIGHGDSGSTLLRMLTTSKELMTGLKNTGLWMAQEQADGTFQLKILNGKPYVATPAPAATSPALPTPP